ncbi:MAG: TonB-dependent receptor [Pseudomonadota bacterium]
MRNQKTASESKYGSLQLALLTLAIAQASGTLAAEAQPGAVEEVTVTARRPLAESNAAALQAQRNSNSLVSVLAADLIGDLPDQNVAFAVGRLPGVAVERDQGQARYINLRGAPVYWTTLSFDGLSIVSPEGRASRFDNIPSAIASQITVEKAIVPSMSGNTVAGNVDIRTRRAFDNPGQKLTGKLGLGKVDLGGGDELDSSLVYSNIFMDGKLGLVTQGSFYMREMATDNWETDPYLTNTIAPEKHFAREHENKHYRLTRENYSFTTRLDYNINEDNTVFASTINTLFHDDELRDNFIVRFDQGTDAAGNAYTSAAYINANSPLTGTVYGARLNARVDYRDGREMTKTHTLGGEHKMSSWDLSWRANHTHTDDGRNTPVTAALQSPSSFLLRPTVEYDFRNGDAHTMRFFSTGGATAARTQGAQITNIEDFQFPMQSIGQLMGGDITRADTFKLDLDHDMELFGLQSKLEIGGLYTDRTKTSEETSYTKTFTGAGIPTWATFADDISYLGGQDLNYRFRYTDRALTADYMDEQIRNGTAILQDTRANYWEVTENIKALYAMATSDFSWGNLVYGVRAEQIENTGEAYVTFPAAGTTPAQTRLVETQSDETLFYPSVHLNWNATDDIKVRYSLTTSASRADFDDLRPNFTINDASQTISGGNPEAEPERQVGADAYLEWYLKDGSFFSAGVFYKDIRDVLVQKSTTFGLDTLDVAGIDRSGYMQTSVGNGGDGYLSGVEVAYSTTIESLAQELNWPQWTQGFGMNFSATFTDSEVNLPAVGGVPARTINVLGTSDEVYNLQGTYEMYGLTVRLAYQYRTPWGQSVGAYRVINGAVYPVDDGDIYWDTDEELDLSVRYQLSSQLELFFDAVNLTDMGARRYGDASRYPIEFEKFGPRYIGGVRFNY